jgi:hypothetical protein
MRVKGADLRPRRAADPVVVERHCNGRQPIFILYGGHAGSVAGAAVVGVGRGVIFRYRVAREQRARAPAQGSPPAPTSAAAVWSLPVGECS